MKKILIQTIFEREWLLYLVSICLAFILTVVLFLILNNRYDSKLQGALKGPGKLASAQIVLSYKYYQLTHPDAWTGDIDRNNEEFVSKWKTFADNATTTNETLQLANLMLYNDANIGSYSARKEGFLLPYIANPNISLNDVMRQLDWSKLETYFGTDGIDNVKRFFSLELSDQLDLLKKEKAYIKRRYLNGSIQFITFWVAIVGLLMLASFLGSISIEKLALKEGIQSFDLPQNMESYKIGQLEETMVRLRDQQRESTSRLREMLINTVSTFSWRGKEESESTLNLEIQELRENMDSRFGMIKYFAWAVPSIGFIGTVIGIGDALGNAHNVIGQTAEYQTKGQIQLITGQLGIAFDTTLISLLLSIVLVLLIHILTRREEHLISSAVITVKRELLQKIAPLERANKLRRFNLLLESLKSHTSPAELQTEPFVSLKQHLEDELNQNNN